MQQNVSNSKFQHNLSLKLLPRKLIQYIPGSILPALASLGFAAVFTRIFGASSFGQFMLVLGVANLIIMIGGQWFQQPLGRYLSAAILEEEQIKIKYAALYSLGLILVFLFILFTLLFIFFINTYSKNEWMPFFIPTCIFVVSYIAFNTFQAVLTAEMRAGEFSLFKSLDGIFRLIFALVIVFFIDRNASGLMWAFAFSALTLAIFQYIKLDLPGLRSVLNNLILNGLVDVFKSIKKFAIYGIPMAGWFLTSTFLQVGDRFIIQWLLGATEVGIYTANYSLVEGAVGLITAPLIFAVYPFLMKAWGCGDEKSASKWLGFLVEKFIAGGIIITGMIWVFSYDIARVLLGIEFREGHFIMPIVIAGIIIWNLGMYVHKPLEFKEKTTVMLRFGLIAALLNLILNVIFIRIFGYSAAAYTTLFCYMFYTVNIGWIGRSILKWNIDLNKITKYFLLFTILFWGLIFLKDSLQSSMGFLFGCILSLFISTTLIVIIVVLIENKLREIVKNIFKRNNYDLN